MHWLAIALAIYAGGCQSVHSPGAKVMRTEVYFGLNIPAESGGGSVSGEQFQSFLDEFVTPRFPDGYTVLTAEGRWEDTQTRKTISEPSRVVIILHEPGKASSAKIDEIRDAYKQRFHQQAVLRVDDMETADF
jgi:hypothetical protein